MHKSTEENLNNLDYKVVDDSLFKSLQGFLIFGKLCGILPFKGVFSNTSTNLRFSWLSFSSAISYVILLILTFNAIMEALLSATASKKNAYEIAQSIRSTLYYVWGTFIYLNFIARANSFLGIFRAWRSCSVYFTKPDLKLKRDCIVISVVILLSGTLENSLLYIGYAKDILFPGADRSKKNSTLELYYFNSHHSWAKYIAYNPFVAVLAFFQHKLILFGWNYMDILIALLGRALYFKFKSLYESADEALVDPFREQPKFKGNSMAPQQRDGKAWIQLAKDHRALCELMQVFEDFLSPLIFVSYMINIYYICMQLLDGLTVDHQKNNWIDVVYKPWSFIHLTMRIYVVTICCARVNMYAHQISNVIADCPADYYNSDISRLDKRVSGGREIGLSGLGCFTVTKPFFLSFIGVIFTFEIVLLQVIPGSETGQKCR